MQQKIGEAAGVSQSETGESPSEARNVRSNLRIDQPPAPASGGPQASSEMVEAAGVLPLGPLRMWTAHRVPTRVQGVALPNPKAGKPRPILMIKQKEVASSSSTPLDAQEDGAMPLDGETAGSAGGATTGGPGTEN